MPARSVRGFSLMGLNLAGTPGNVRENTGNGGVARTKHNGHYRTLPGEVDLGEARCAAATAGPITRLMFRWMFRRLRRSATPQAAEINSPGTGPCGGTSRTARSGVGPS